MTLPNHIQSLPHQQGHGALITALGSSLGRCTYFSSLEAWAVRLSGTEQPCVLVAALFIASITESRQNRSRIFRFFLLFYCTNVSSATFFLSSRFHWRKHWIVLPPKVALVKYRWNLCLRGWMLLYHTRWNMRPRCCFSFDMRSQRIWGCSFTNRGEWSGYIGLDVEMIHAGGHSEGRTFNLAGEVELIPLLPVYTRSSNASLFSLSPRSSISPIYLLPPHTLAAESTPTHSIYVACVRLCVCVWKSVYSTPIPLFAVGDT